jgi:hypothetical protein
MYRKNRNSLFLCGAERLLSDQSEKHDEDSERWERTQARPSNTGGLCTFSRRIHVAEAAELTGCGRQSFHNQIGGE